MQEPFSDCETHPVYLIMPPCSVVTGGSQVNNSVDVVLDVNLMFNGGVTGAKQVLY